MKSNNMKRKPKKNILNWALMILLMGILVFSMKKLNDNRAIELEYKKQVAAQNVAKKDTSSNSTTSNDKVSNKKVVILDPGHGGFDEGASTGDKSLLEKDVTLKLCKRIKYYLSTENIDVVLTRDSDKAMDNAENEKEDLRNRIKFINSYKNALLLVSIHNNSNDDPNCHGIFNYISSSKDIDTSKSMELSSSVLKAIDSSSKWDINSTLEQDIYILNNSSIPSILIECGFLTSDTDIKNLKSPQSVDDLSKAIAKGIKSYIDKNK